LDCQKTEKMKIIVTGSLGHTGRPLTEQLVKTGHEVVVVSSKPDRQKEIGSMGAKAAIGSVEDVEFLVSVFSGADAVYCMLPPGGFFDPNFDLMAKVTQLAQNYKKAISGAGVKKVIHLSSIGAHTDQNNGLLAFHYKMENILRQLPQDVAIKHLRPVGFYYNLLSFIPGIKTNGVIASNYGGDDKKPWVSTLDIAEVTAEEITGPFEGRTIRYIASDEISCSEIARILGVAIGKPDLQWIRIPAEQLRSTLVAIGMNPGIAAGLVAMQESINSGELYEDYYRHRPVLGNTKIKDFAPQFAAAYLAADKA
jgi:uncharacterized protein YbjT (DUF2867 family)